jgi:hypothetical protein
MPSGELVTVPLPVPSELTTIEKFCPVVVPK